MSDRFESLPFSEEQIDISRQITQAAYRLERAIAFSGLLDPRCEALAMTALEETVMWANKGVSRPTRDTNA